MQEIGADAALSGAADGGADAATVPFDAGQHTDSGVRAQCTADFFTSAGDAWVMDVSTLVLPPPSTSQTPSLIDPLKRYNPPSLPWVVRAGTCFEWQCLEREQYLSLVLQDSDTNVGLVQGISYEIGESGEGARNYAALTNEDALALSRLLDEQAMERRTLFVANVMPNDRPDLQWQRMTELAPDAVAFRANTAWRPGGDSGFFLDDAIGTAFIERGIALGVPIFMVPKGMPLPSFSASHTHPRDIGPVAARFPQASFVVLQAAFEAGFDVGASSRPDEAGDAERAWGEDIGLYPEGPYAPDDADTVALYPLDRGVNSLITSLREHGIGPNDNVYAALDGVWAELMTRPVEAAHVLGKLLKYIGEDNVLWGTQSLLYGGPQPQIDAFRAFEIPVELQEAHGYPALTPERKAKILGRNAARLFCDAL